MPDVSHGTPNNNSRCTCEHIDCPLVIRINEELKALLIRVISLRQLMIQLTTHLSHDSEPHTPPHSPPANR